MVDYKYNLLLALCSTTLITRNNTTLPKFDFTWRFFFTSNVFCYYYYFEWLLYSIHNN